MFIGFFKILQELKLKTLCPLPNVDIDKMLKFHILCKKTEDSTFSYTFDEPLILLSFPTHCRLGGRLLWVSHTPIGSRFFGTLYLRDHWEALRTLWYFANNSTKWICSSTSSATTFCRHDIQLK